MSSDQEAIETYNYAHFQGGGDEFLAFRSSLPVGSKAPDFTALLLGTGEPVRLSDYWQTRDLLIEFGSLT